MDEKRLDRLEDKIDKIIDKLEDHSKLHTKNSADLEHHIKRTDLLEESLKLLKQTDTIIRAGVKSFAVVAAILSILYTIVRLYKGI